jgi:hypothetical protein
MSRYQRRIGDTRKIPHEVMHSLRWNRISDKQKWPTLLLRKQRRYAHVQNCHVFNSPVTSYLYDTNTELSTI